MMMKTILIGVLLVLAISSVSARRGKGKGKGKPKCADGSAPTCSEGPIGRFSGQLIWLKIFFQPGVFSQGCTVKPKYSTMWWNDKQQSSFQSMICRLVSPFQVSGNIWISCLTILSSSWPWPWPNSGQAWHYYQIGHPTSPVNFSKLVTWNSYSDSSEFQRVDLD